MVVVNFSIFMGESRFDGRASNPKLIWRRKQAVFIRLEDDRGFVGWGECWCFDHSADSLIRFIQTEIRDNVIGAKVTSIEEIWESLWSKTSLSGRHGMTAAAISGVDCALWDIHAQRQSMPLSQAISGPNVKMNIPVYASGGLYVKGEDHHHLGGVLKSYQNAGYQSVKMKFGAGSFNQDLLRLQKAREIIGPDIELIIDAVYSLNQEKVNKWLPYWHELGIKIVQAPFLAHDWDSMCWLNDECKISVMAFESECRYEIFRGLLEKNAIDILQFSPIAVGGITASIKLIGLAKQFGKTVSLQCSSSWVAEIIAFQLAGAFTSVRNVEVHQFHRMLFEYADPNHLVITDGFINLGRTAGLGFSVPNEAVISCDDKLPDFTYTI